MKKILLILGGLLGLCIVVALLAIGGGFFFTQGAATSGETFMTALKDSDYKKAFDQCAPALQQEIKSVEDLQAMIENGNVKPVSWAFNNRNVNNDQGELSGTATLSDNRTADLSIVLTKIENDWKIVGFNIKQR
jgi:hypothetical protein